jgi:hypothetical protein
MCESDPRRFRLIDVALDGPSEEGCETGLWLNCRNPVVFDPNLRKQHPGQRVALGTICSAPGGRQIVQEGRGPR